MSHILESSIVIKDLECLDAAVKAMGAILVRGKKTYNWFGRSVGDYPLPAGTTAAELGKCDHVIQLPGACYEIGVVQKKDGSYKLLYDFYGSDHSEWRAGQHHRHDGNKLQRHFGEGLCKLQVAYTEMTVRKTAKQHGFTVHRTVLPSGEVKLKCVPSGVKNFSYQKVTA